MVEFYNEEYLYKIDRQRFNLKLIYVISLIFSIALILTLTILIAFQPYDTKFEKVSRWIIAIYLSVYIIFSFIYLKIPYARVKYYQYFVLDCMRFAKNQEQVTIVGINNETTYKNGVDFYYLDIIEWSERENDFINRSVLVDCEIKNLDLNKGEIVTITTASNVLIAYEK